MPTGFFLGEKLKYYEYVTIQYFKFLMFTLWCTWLLTWSPAVAQVPPVAVYDVSLWCFKLFREIGCSPA